MEYNEKVNKYLDRIKSNHGNFYDYSKVDYVRTTDKVTIICPVHGEFQQRWIGHVSGKGCSKCGRYRASSSHLSSTDEFISKAKKKYGDRYDYSLTKYIKAREKVVIICPEHGEFLQTPYKHLSSKHGCIDCGNNVRAGSVFNKMEAYSDKMDKHHNNKYDYSKVDLRTVKTRDMVTIICPEHGEFTQQWSSHIHGGYGCLECASEQTSSKPELELLDFIRSIYNGIVMENVRSIIAPLEIDIYLPELNIAIEFNGLYFHSEINKPIGYHRNKHKQCVNKNIRLIQIWEHEWAEQQELCKNFIKSLILQPSKLYARKLTISNVSVDEQREFLNIYHFQGYTSTTSAFGLYDNGILVQIMTFKKLDNNGNYEIGRLCTKSDYVVIGGADRLFKKLIEENNPKTIISYNNLDKFNGEVYSRLGLTMIENYIKSYFYHRRDKAFSRQQFQKHKLVEQGHDVNMSEVEIANSMGYYRVFPTGNSKYLKKF